VWLTDWQKDFGGYTSYIAEGEDEEVSLISGQYCVSVCWPFPLVQNS